MELRRSGVGPLRVQNGASQVWSWPIKSSEWSFAGLELVIKSSEWGCAVWSWLLRVQNGLRRSGVGPLRVQNGHLRVDQAHSGSKRGNSSRESVNCGRN
jgi:hypothetical protein